MRHANTNVLSTAGFHAHLTYKQADILKIMEDEDLTGTDDHYEIASCLAELQYMDIEDGKPTRYISVTPQATYGTLRTMEQRGLVKRGDRGAWLLTSDGAKVARDFCRWPWEN